LQANDDLKKLDEHKSRAAASEIDDLEKTLAAIEDVHQEMIKAQATGKMHERKVAAAALEIGDLEKKLAAALQQVEHAQMLQCVAVCCSVVQRGAVCCRALQCVDQLLPAAGGARADDAVCCSVLQRGAACCNVLLVAVRCHGLQCVAVCCHVLQCVAVC